MYYIYMYIYYISHTVCDILNTYITYHITKRVISYGIYYKLATFKNT